VIVTRYWLTEGMPRIEVIEWQTAGPFDTSTTVTIPEIAEVEEVIPPTTPVQWVSVCQPSFDAPLDQGVDFYTLPPAEGAEVLTKADWDAAVAMLENEKQEADAARQAEIEQRVTRRNEAIEKIAKSAKLTTEQTQALIGGL
jgi:hypothetical protein